MILSFIISIGFSLVPDDQIIADKINREKQEYVQKDKKVRRHLAELYKLQKKLKYTQKKINKLDKEKHTKTRDIKKLTKKIKQISEEIKETKDILQVRLRIASQVLDSSLQEIIVFSKSPNEIERTLKGLEAIMEKDIHLIKKVEDKKKKYAKGQKQLREDIVKFRDNKRALRASIQELIQYKKEKEGIVHKLKKDKVKHKIALDLLREEGEDLVLLSNSLTKSLARQIMKKSFFEYKGQLPKPIKGKILEGFGEKTKDGLHFFSKGVWILGDSLQEVKAVAGGRVVFNGHLNERTRAVVVDHGDHYYSIYAPISNTSLSKGQKINYQDVIGRLGENMIQEQASLYFELRHYSEPVNPERWFTKQTKPLSKSEVKGDSNEVY